MLSDRTRKAARRQDVFAEAVASDQSMLPAVEPSAPLASPAVRPVSGALREPNPLRRSRSVPETPRPGPSAPETLRLSRSATADPLGGSDVDPGIADALRRRAGGGQQLPTTLSGSLGEHFEQDFSSVRVHQDAEAGNIAGALASHAFTHGNDLYFAPGKFKPDAPDGQRLIAHELGHVVAQRTGADTGSGGGLTVGRAQDPAEAAADRAADGAMSALRRKASGGETHQHGQCRCPPAESALRRSAAPGSVVRGSAVRGSAVRRSVVRREGDTAVAEKGNTFEKGSGAFAGSKKESEDGVNKSTSKAVAGAWGEASAEHDSFNGKVAKKGKAEASGMAGAEAYLTLIKTATPEELSVAFESCARAGVFGKAEAVGEISRGPLKAGGEASAEGGIGASAGASGSATIDRSGKIPKLEAAFAAFAQAGVDFKVAASGFVGIGPAQIMAAVEAAGFAGVRASAEGSVSMNAKDGLTVKGKAEAMAGAEVSGKASVTAKLGNQEVTAALAGEAFAGAKASAEGKVSISLTGIEVSGKAEAFAGVSAEASGSLEWTSKGRTIFAATGTVTVDAGIGGKAEGTFVFKNGKLSISFGAKAVFGVGFGAELAAELDFVALGGAIYGEVNDAINRSSVSIGDSAGKIDRQPVVDQLVAIGLVKRGYEAYIADFRGYAGKKMSDGKNGIKKERVQEILDFRRGQVGMDLVYGETDQGITKAAVEAFGPLLKSIVIKGGKIESFTPAAFTEVAGIRKKNTQDTTLAAFRTALSTEVGKVRTAGANMPDPEMMKKVIGKHYGKVSAARTPDEADTEMATIVEDVYAGLISGFTMKAGVPGSFRFDAKAIGDKDKAAAAGKVEGPIKATLAEITALCAAYAAKKAESGKNGIKGEVINSKMAGQVKKLNTGLDAPAQKEMDARIAQAIKDGLGGAAKSLTVDGGTITVLDAADANAIKKGNADDKLAAVRQTAYAAATEQFVEYAAKKARKGDNGVKPDKVQAIVTTAYKKVGTDPAAMAEADAKLAEEAKKAFGDIINHLTITGGQVVMVVSQTKTKTVKDKVTSDSARVGADFGEEDGNKRRYNVRNALHEKLTTYFTRIRANPRGVPTIGEVQQIVTAGISKFRSEMTFDDAKAELQRAISEASDGYYRVNRVDDSGTLYGASADMSALLALRGKDGEAKKDEVVLKALASPLASLAKTFYKKRPTLTTLQAVVDKAAKGWGAGADTATPVDELISKAITLAFDDKIKEVVVTGGRVVVLKIAS
ncbi:DUF4157 domain-containing protein [Nakamurella sp. UYEF19]|uniref:eCIS core domain-containing protein n=1 Tax=Nakamurella sp. UYEF19 TaxID=1756392 RepID=UPI003391E5F8